MENDVIFQPLKFRHLEVKNRIFRAREILRETLNDSLDRKEATAS